MVSGGVDDRDPVLLQTPHLPQEEALGLEGEPLPVEEVAGDEDRVDVLADRQVRGPAERFAGGVTQASAHLLGTARECGVEVDVGDVQEAHGPR